MRYFFRFFQPQDGRETTIYQQITKLIKFLDQLKKDQLVLHILQVSKQRIKKEKMNFNSSMSIDLNLVHSAQGISAQQLPVSQNTKKRLVGNDTPKSSRSRISTEALINYDQRQNAINMIRNQQNEGKKIKFSEMMNKCQSIP